MSEEPAASDTALVQPEQVPRLIVPWIAAIVLSVVVIVFTPPEQRAEWTVFSIGVIIVLSFVLQLGTAVRERFITRLSFSVVIGSVIIGIAHIIAKLAGF